MGWIVVDEKSAAASWDQWASTMPFSSPFQSYAIGKYARQIDATPFYCVYFDESGAVCAMALCTIKARVSKVAIFACNGGPMGDPALWSGLPEALRQAAGLKFVYLRFRCDVEFQDADAATLVRTGWRRALVTSGTSRTMILDLSKSMDTIKAGLARNWRRDLEHALKEQLVLSVNASVDPAEIHEIMAAMVATKQFASTIGEAHIRALIENRGSNIVFVSAANAEGAVVAFRCSLVLGNHAVDFIAATSPLGRELRASFAVFWHQIIALQALGVTDFDLGGIDPEGNPGVYTFKVRTGAVERKMLGEFEIANVAALVGAVNLALRARELKSSLRNKLTALRRLYK